MQFRAIFPIIFSAFYILTGCASLENALENAIVSGDITQVKTIIAKDRSKIYAKDSLEETPLHKAVKLGHLEIVKYLVSEGANTNTKDQYGDTALHDAVQFGAGEEKEKIIRYLLSNGANADIKNNLGSSPLYLSIYFCDLNLIKDLVAAGADVNTSNNLGDTPLIVSIKKESVEKAEYLISKGADVNESNQLGATALHYAASINDRDLVELLVSNGANIKSQDNNGKTALSYAKENGHTEIIEFLATKNISSDPKYIVQESKTDLHSKTYQDIIPKSTTPEFEKDNKANQTIPSNVDFGRYFSLVIGINNYQSLPKLKTAINDANSVADLLQNGYGFSIDLLTDATRSDILLALSKLRNKLAKRDNLLIYYAGHGWLDVEADEGYWLPSDAEADNDINWVSNSSITAKLKAMDAKHVLIVSDSCYSGKLGRGVHIKHRTPSYFTRISQKRTRSVISSGGLEPVADSGGGGNHSVFATAFINALKENRGIIDGTQLFIKIRRPIMLNSDQTPEYSDIRKAGHEGGDFLFVRKK